MTFPTANSPATLEYAAQVFDAETSIPATPPLAHDTLVARLAFSKDGSRLVTMANAMGSLPYAANVWDIASGKRLLGPVTHGPFPMGHVLASALSPDGRWLITGGMDDARVWDVEQGTTSGEIAPVDGAVERIVFSPDGRRFATLRSVDGTSRVWETNTLSPLTPPLRQVGTTIDLRFNADGRLLITNGILPSSSEMESRVWDVSGPVPGTPKSIKVRAATRDGRIVLRSETRTLVEDRRRVRETSLQLFRREDDSPASPPVVLPRGKTVRHAVVSEDARRVIVEYATRADSRTGTIRTWDFQSDPPIVGERKNVGTTCVDRPVARRPVRGPRRRPGPAISDEGPPRGAGGQS